MPYHASVEFVVALEVQTYVHSNRHYHQSLVKLDQWLVLHQSVLLQESILHGPQEVPVKSSVDDQDDNLGDLIPDLIDVDEDLGRRRVKVRRDPDAHDHDVDRSDQHHSSPFQPPHCATTLRDERYAVNDDLHEKLNLKHPAYHQEEQGGNSTVFRQCLCDAAVFCEYSRRPDVPVKEYPSQNTNHDVGHDLSP